MVPIPPPPPMFKPKFNPSVSQYVRLSLWIDVRAMLLSYGGIHVLNDAFLHVDCKLTAIPKGTN